MVVAFPQVDGLLLIVSVHVSVCDLCDHEHLGDCPEHGPLKHFVDTYVSIALHYVRRHFSEKQNPNVLAF